LLLLLVLLLLLLLPWRWLVVFRRLRACFMQAQVLAALL
jgi:hypothetical protein